MPAVDFDAPEPATPTKTLPVKTLDERWVRRPDTEPEE
jgi:hypothetical protein